MRRWLIALLPKIFLLRVPLLVSITILVLGWKLASSPLRGLLYLASSPTDPLYGWRQMWALSTVAFLATAACLVNLHVIGRGAGDRFGVPIALPSGVTFFLAHVPSLVLLGYVIGHSKDRLLLSSGLAVGWLSAAAIVFFSEKVRNLFIDPDKAAGHPLSLIWPSLQPTSRFHRSLQASRDRDLPSLLKPLKDLFIWLWRWPRSLLLPFLDKGYFEPANAAAHAYAGFIAVGTYLLYLTFANLQELALLGTRRAALQSIQTHSFGLFNVEGLSAITWVLLFLILATWVLGAATFFLDRFRVPLLAGIALVAAITWSVPESDLFYRSGPPKQNGEWRRKPSDVVREHDGPIVLVSAPGGGIQSAAWTTYVLAQLDQRSNPPFTSKIAAISSVSGGSVGIFHLAAANFKSAEAYANAIKPSIDDVAWGLFVPDLAHILQPWARQRWLDRGWALEQSLENNARADEPGSNNGGLVLDSPALREPGRPALILNSTILEAGHPLVFSTTQFTEPLNTAQPPCGPRALPGGDYTDPYDYWDLYQRSVRLVTAARLSAGFPYVSPSARGFPDAVACPDFHLLDGGYYDNYGIVSLVKWIRTAFKEGAPPREIVLVRLFAFTRDYPRPSVMGWGGQVSAPLIGILHARDDSQLALGRYIQKLFAETGVKVTSYDFRYNESQGQPVNPECNDAPLNWVLTDKEIRCIEGTPLDASGLLTQLKIQQEKKP